MESTKLICGIQSNKVRCNTHLQMQSNEFQGQVDVFVIPTTGELYIHKMEPKSLHGGSTICAQLGSTTSAPRIISVNRPGGCGHTATFAIWIIPQGQDTPLNRWVYSLIGSPIFRGELVIALVDSNFDIASVESQDLHAIKRAVQRYDVKLQSRLPIII